MKKLLLLIFAAVLLVGCSQGETQKLTQPYNVETAREAEKVAETTPESRNYDVAPAVIATITPTPTPEVETPAPEPETVTEPEENHVSVLTCEAVVEPEPESVVEAVPVEPEPEPIPDDMPTPADEFAYYDMVLLGGYIITWYSRDMVGYDAPGASGNGLTPYYSCAMPDYGLLNCTVYVENYGFFHVDDISPDGICDLYVNSVSDIPAYGQDYQMVYIVG